MMLLGPVGAQPRGHCRWAMRPSPKFEIVHLSCRLQHLRSALDGSAPAPFPPRSAMHGAFGLSRRQASGPHPVGDAAIAQI